MQVRILASSYNFSLFVLVCLTMMAYVRITYPLQLPHFVIGICIPFRRIFMDI